MIVSFGQRTQAPDDHCFPGILFCLKPQKGVFYEQGHFA